MIFRFNTSTLRGFLRPPIRLSASGQRDRLLSSRWRTDTANRDPEVTHDGPSQLSGRPHGTSGGRHNGLGPDYKAIDGPGVLRAAGLRTFLATSPQAARAVLADAVAAAMTGAAVSLRLPTNVQLAEIERPEKPLLIRQIERNAAPAK